MSEKFNESELKEILTRNKSEKLQAQGSLAKLASALTIELERSQRTIRRKKELKENFDPNPVLTKIRSALKAVEEMEHLDALDFLYHDFSKFKVHANNIVSYLPSRRTRLKIETSHLVSLLGRIRLHCEDCFGEIRWYFTDTWKDKDPHYGTFFEICRLTSHKLGVNITDNTIKTYIQKKVKPNRELLDKTANACKEQYPDGYNIDIFFKVMDEISLGDNPTDNWPKLSP